jgi:hypothetical protein
MKRVDISATFHKITMFPEMSFDVGSGDGSLHTILLFVKYYEVRSVQLEL